MDEYFTYGCEPEKAKHEVFVRTSRISFGIRKLTGDGPTRSLILSTNKPTLLQSTDSTDAPSGYACLKHHGTEEDEQIDETFDRCVDVVNADDGSPNFPIERQLGADHPK